MLWATKITMVKLFFAIKTLAKRHKNMLNDKKNDKASDSLSA